MTCNRSTARLCIANVSAILVVVAALGAALLVPSSNAQAALIAAYKMNEAVWNGTPGEVLDSSGNGFNATSVNYPPGAPGTFNGINQYVITPNLTAAVNSTTSVGLALDFNATPGGGGGVLVDEIGQAALNTGWHDSQLEVEANGDVHARVWNTATLNLGNATFGQTHHVSMFYDSSTGTLSGTLDGITTSLFVGARQAPWQNGSQQYYAFGAGDAGTNLGNGNFFNGSISNAQITTPEPGSMALLGIGAASLLVWRRRKTSAAARLTMIPV